MIQWQPHVGPVLMGGLILAAAAWLVWVYRRLRERVDARRAAWLMVPRAIATVLVLVAFLDPVIVREQASGDAARILAVLDASSSMEVADVGEPRKAAARRALDRLERQLGGGVRVEKAEFDTSLRKGAAPASPDAVTGLRGTDLGRCLQELGETTDTTGYRAVVILTDGGDEAIEQPASLATPVCFVGIGSDPATWDDVRIDDLVHPASVEKDTEFEVSVDVAASNAKRRPETAFQSLSIRMEEETPAGWKPAGEKPVDLRRLRARVGFTLKGSDEGIHRYRVRLAGIPGELSELNNARSFSVDVGRKAIHVLYFTRELGADFKVLRNELGRDPGVALTSLFRTLGERFTVQGERRVGDEELDAGFPGDVATLGLFDCIMLGAFPATEWTEAQRKALAAYVEEGGTVVFFGGENAFGRGGYTGSALAPLFPWAISPLEPDMARGKLTVNVVPGVSSHPIVAGLDRLMAEAGDPVIESVSQPGMLRPAALALLETRVDGEPQAVLALQPYGKGRVLAFASNSLWKWALATGSLRDAYGRLLRQAVRSLAGEKEGGRILSVQWDRDAYRPGETATAHLRLAGRDVGRDVRLAAAVSRGGKSEAVAVEPQQGTGGFRVRVPLKERGEYPFVLTAIQGNATLETYAKTLRAAPLLDEGARLDVDAVFLRRLAERTGGIYAPVAELDSMGAWLRESVLTRGTVTATAWVSDGPLFFALFLVCLLAEWALRRRLNLV